MVRPCRPFNPADGQYDEFRSKDVRSHTCQVDNLIILHSGFRKTSELQTTFSLQAVGICLATEGGETILDELFGVLQWHTLIDVHLSGVARLECWGLKRYERGIAVW